MAEMDAAAWRRLERVEAGSVMLDMRSLLDKVEIPAFLKLYERGYCTLVETGPGDSVHLFSLTEAGKEALDARRGDSSQRKDKDLTQSGERVHLSKERERKTQSGLARAFS